MKKLHLTVFSVICVICMAFSLMIMSNVNTASANVSGMSPTLSATKVMRSNDNSKMLLVTAIKDFGDVYEVGYTGIEEDDKIHADTDKFYTSISVGLTVWNPEDIFAEDWADEDGVGMIIWEINFAIGTSYSFKPYALVGERNDLDQLVLPDEEVKVTPVDSIEKQYFTIVFEDEDGTELQSSVVASGSTPAYTGAIPTKAATAQYTYAFDGWNNAIVAASANATYTATYSSTVNQYTITFKNEDGTTLQSGLVNYGATPAYNEATPTKAATAQYSYTFDGWDNAIVAVTGDAIYTATYSSTLNQYTVTFKNADGTTLQSGPVNYGETPVYTGATPIKASTSTDDFVFCDFGNIATVTEAATYTARYYQIEKDALASFSNNVYEGSAEIVANNDGIESAVIGQEVLASYTDTNSITVENVMKITVYSGYSNTGLSRARANVKIKLPKGYTSAGYTLKYAIDFANMSSYGFFNPDMSASTTWDCVNINDTWNTTYVDMTTSGDEVIMSFFAASSTRDTFYLYVAWVKEDRVIEVPSGYLAYYNSALYEGTAEIVANGDGLESAVTGQELLASYTDANDVTVQNVMKLTVYSGYSQTGLARARANVKVKLPKGYTAAGYTLKYAIDFASMSTYGFFNPDMTASTTWDCVNNNNRWKETYADMSAAGDEVIMTFFAGSSVNDTFYVYFAWVKEGDARVLEVPEGYLAYYNSELYEGTVEIVPNGTGVGSAVTGQEVLASYTDVNGMTVQNVMKLTVCSGYDGNGFNRARANVKIELPQGYTAAGYTLKYAIDFAGMSTYGFFNPDMTASTTWDCVNVNNRWNTTYVDMSTAGDEVIMTFFAGSSINDTFYVYLAWVKEGDAREIEVPDGYLAYYNDMLYEGTAEIVPNGTGIESAVTGQEVLASYTDANDVTVQNVMKITVYSGYDGNGFDRARANVKIELPQGYTAAGYTLKYAIDFAGMSTYGFFNPDMTASTTWDCVNTNNTWTTAYVDMSTSGDEVIMTFFAGSTRDTFYVYLAWVKEGDATL